MVCDELNVVMLCKWRHHPSGGSGVVSAGYTVLYVPEYATVRCISHNEVSFMYSRRRLDITWCKGRGTRWSSDRVPSADPFVWKLPVQEVFHCCANMERRSVVLG
jgi:hypothetical protein